MEKNLFRKEEIISEEEAESIMAPEENTAEEDGYLSKEDEEAYVKIIGGESAKPEEYRSRGERKKEKQKTIKKMRNVGQGELFGR